MKKKFVTLLTAAFVMAMSVTSVFAAPSVSIESAVELTQDDVVAKVESGEAGVQVSKQEVTTTTVKKEDAVAAVEVVEKSVAASVTVEAGKKVVVKNAEVKAVADIKVELVDKDGNPVEVSEENPVWIQINVPGLVPGQNVAVLNYYDGAWHNLVHGGAGNGEVSAKFTHCSPVMVITYDVETVEATPDAGANDNADSNDNAGSNAGTTDTTPTSPKTGVLPVAAITAGICLAGVAVCGKKVKFN